MLNTQTDIGSFNQRIIEDLIKVNTLSEEQAKELLGREQNGPGRKHVLQLLSVQVRKTAKMGEGNNVDTPVGKGPGGNLLDPEVSALCVVFFCLHIIFGRAVLVRTHNRICINKDTTFVFAQVRTAIQIKMHMRTYRRILRNSH